MKTSFLEDLQSALDTFDWKQAEKICEELIGELNLSTIPYNEAAIGEILKALRQKRQFGLMSRVADAFMCSAQPTTEILRQYGQSMIDQGNLTASRLVLQSIVDNAHSLPKEKAEAHGLLGRIYKQLYVNAGDAFNPRQQQNLREALNYYYSVYKTDSKSFLWHGINTVALLARSGRDHVATPALPSMREIALEIDATLKKIGSLNLWDRATAVEDAVALNDFKNAYDHALYFALDKEVNAFEVASLLRQLTDVWQLKEDSEPGNTLLPILKAALLKCQGGQVAIDAKKINTEVDNAQNAHRRLERVFGTDRYKPLGWLKTALQRSAAVGRVESLTGTRIGSGFLVKAHAFFENRDPEELLFLTNAHVVSPVNQPFPGAISPQAARIVFEATGEQYAVEKLIWSSAPTSLDATFLALKSLDPKTECCLLEPPPAAFNIEKKARVYVIGYPLGGGLSISLQDSIWLDADERVLHYRTPTEPGSSGSPVFDEEYWTVIGLHHLGDKNLPRLRGGGTYEANEGIAIAAIQKATKSGTPA
jgi:V8-like Glu-specific endopeptidase